jgi:hydrogenase 3 maturation protease
MLPNSWRASLHLLRNQQRDRPRVAIVGIGNILRSDDAAGIFVARALKDSPLLSNLDPVLVIDAGHAPENSTANLRRFAPDMILLIDAADMAETPGTIRWIEMDELDGMSASTHTMPLSILAKYLTLELHCKIALLGIQPASNDIGETLHPEVADAVDQVVSGLIEALAGS